MSHPSASDPLRNPANARVDSGTAIAVRPRQLWIEESGGAIHAAWRRGGDTEVVVGSKLRMYIDGSGGLNGWCHVASGEAVNQRGLGDLPDVRQASPVDLPCARCAHVWTAPAAGLLLSRGEQCLECNSPLRAPD